MATTTAHVNTQLTADKQKQHDTATAGLKTRELAAFLSSAIHYHRKEGFYAKLQEGADVNFSGLDDRNEYVNPPLTDAILSSNTWAFDELLKRKANVHRAAEKGTAPLFLAAAEGNVHMVRELLNHGANPLDYRKGPCLPLMLEFITTNALLDSQSRWRYEYESPDTDNAELKRQISEFFLQEGAYMPPQPNKVIPFVAPEQTIHVHYEGKLEILGLLLSRHVSPILPVAGTTRSALAIVQNPTKYYDHFRSNAKENLEYIETEAKNPHTLVFTMTLVNKRNTGTIPARVILHYDLEPSKQLIEAAVSALNPHMLAVTASLSQGMQEAGNKLNEELEAVKRKLSDTHREAEQTAHEMKNVKDAVHYTERKEIEEFNALISGHPNAKEGYEHFQIGLNALYTSALAVKGGGVTVSEGSLSLVASVLDIGKDLIELPLVGSLLGLASAATKEVDRARQTNLFENIATMATPKDARKAFEAVARKLTMAYLLQFERLATRENALAQMSKTQQFVQVTKGKMLNTRFKSPAEQITAFGILEMMENVFNKAHTETLTTEIAEKGLETVLLNAVTQHRSPEKLTSFWNQLTSKLGINAIPIQNASGEVLAETWHPAEFWTGPGVVVETTNGAQQYFIGKDTNVAKFGYRLGNIEDVQALGLVPTTDTLAMPAPSAPVTPAVAKTITPSNNKPRSVSPSLVAYSYPNAPKPEPYMVVNTTCSLALSVSAPPPPYESPASKPSNPSTLKHAKSPSPFARLRGVIKT